MSAELLQRVKNLKPDIAGTHKQFIRSTNHIINHIRSLRLEIIYTKEAFVTGDLQRILHMSIDLHKQQLKDIVARANQTISNSLDKTLEEMLKEYNGGTANVVKDPRVVDHIDALSECLDTFREDISRVLAESEEA